MTNREIENRIRNLEIALSSLASKTHNRDAKAESGISEVDGKADVIKTEADETKAITDENTNGILDLENAIIEISEMLCE